METALNNERRTASHIRIFILVSFASSLYFAIMNFKRHGLPCYPVITAGALVLYSLAVPLAHLAHLELIHARSSDMRVVQLISLNYSMYILATFITALFVVPAIYGAYGLFCQDGGLEPGCALSEATVQFSHRIVQWGATSLLAADCSALITALAILATPTSHIKGSFNRSISLSFVLTSLAMLVNTYSLTRIPPQWASLQGFAEEILSTNLPLLFAFFFSVVMVGAAGAYESLPVEEVQADPELTADLSS